MAKILVNYIYNRSKNTYELLNKKHVLADVDFAILETEQNIKTPLVVAIEGKPTVVDKDEYSKNNKEFKLKVVDENVVVEATDGVAVWLPKDTDVSRLRIINGQLVYEQLN